MVFENVQEANPGPLPGRDLVRIYERIIDVMRALQRNELASERNALASGSHAADTSRGHDEQGHGTGAKTPETGTKQ